MKKISVLLLLLINIIGCSSKTPFDLAQEGPTMKENYESHFIGESGNTQSNSLPINISREMEEDINYKTINEYGYRRIQNPELEMFIYPHRSTRLGVIVPGYSVRFSMYEKVQYGLVGDVNNVK